MAEHGRDTVRSWVVCVVVITLAVLATFWYILSRYDTPVILGAGDSWQYFGPLVHLADVSIHQGEWPQWNPFVCNGMPYAADPQNWLNYPPNLIRSLLNVRPTPYSTHLSVALMIVLHFLVSGISAYALARLHGLSRMSSYIGVFGYLFSANYVFRAFGHPHLCFILAWLPLFMLVVRMLVYARDPVRKGQYTLVAGLLCGLIVTGGFPQLSFLSCLATSLYALFLILPDQKSLEFSPLCEVEPCKGIIAVVRNMALLTVVFVIGAMASAVILLPLAEFAGYSIRSSEMMYKASDDASSIGQLFRVLVCFPGSSDSEGIKGAGASIFLLALFAWIHPRRRDVVLFAILTVIFLDISMGPVLLFGRLIGWLLPFFSAPGRATLVMCLFLSMLAAYGADALAYHVRRTSIRVVSTALLLIVGGLLIPVLLEGVQQYSFLKTPRLALVGPFLLIVCIVLALWIRRPFRWTFILVPLVFFELFVWNYSFIQYTNGSPWHLWVGDLETLKYPRTFPLDDYRRADIQPQWERYDFVPAMSGISPLYLRDVRQILCHPSLEGTYRRHVDGVEPCGSQERGNLFLKRQFWLSRQVVHGALPDKNQPFPSATTLFLPLDERLPLLVPEVEAAELPMSCISEQNAIHMRMPLDTLLEGAMVEADKQLVVTLPEVSLPDRHSAISIDYTSTCSFWLYSVFKDPVSGEKSYGRGHHCPAVGEAGGTATIALPDFPRIQIEFTVVLDDLATSRVMLRNAVFVVDLADEGALIEIQRRTANTVDLRVGPLLRPRMLLFTDPWYPGWKAYRNGEPMVVYRANDAFKAVELPPGTHYVRFVFDSLRVRVGRAVSIGTVLVVVVLLVFLWFRGRKRSLSEPQR